jgi:hypothetical protein
VDTIYCPSDTAHYNYSPIPAFQNAILLTALNGERLIALRLDENSARITGPQAFFQGMYMIIRQRREYQGD